MRRGLKRHHVGYYVNYLTMYVAYMYTKWLTPLGPSFDHLVSQSSEGMSRQGVGSIENICSDA
jgi:hypothetical protein